MLPSPVLIALLLALGGLLYGLLAGWLWARRAFAGRALLIAYVSLAGVWEWINTTVYADWLPWTLARPIVYGGLPLLAVLLLQLNRLFLRREGAGWGWWAAGAIGAAGLVAVDLNLAGWPEPVPLGGLGAIPRGEIVRGLALSLWGGLHAAAVLITRGAYRATSQPLHRNRIKYWTLVLGLTVAGDGLRFAGLVTVGSGLRLLAALLLTYALIIHRLPDVRRAYRRALTDVSVVGLIAALLVAGYWLFGFLQTQITGDARWLAAIALVVIVAAGLLPLAEAARRLVGRLLSGVGYDSAATVREYGLAISNILDLERLAATVVGLTRKTLGSERGVLFLVDEKKEDDWRWAFHLRPIAYPGCDPAEPGVLRAGHGVAHFLRTEHRALTQYDIDLLPGFTDAAREERGWLESMQMDVYVPIYAKEAWIGLLALGPKASRDRYFDDDLLLLNTLADQTAVGLKNARLYEDLVRLNAELTEAYGSLERANHQLQELDRLKSSFLGVITHELRTPFVSLGFSVQLLERHGTDAWAPEQREQLAQLSAGLQSARQMVDGLIAFATLLSKQGQLKMERVRLGEVVTGAVEALRFMADRKGLGLDVIVRDHLPPLIGDAGRLSETVHHLVQNAIQYTEHGKVTVQCWATDESATVEVKDTGPGIPADRLPALWQTFEQMADSTLRGQAGLGLGLALVKYVVTAHGGEVWAHSTVDVGSTFGFYLPTLQARPAAE